MNINESNQLCAVLVVVALLGPPAASAQSQQPPPSNSTKQGAAKRPLSEDDAWKAAVSRGTLGALREFYKEYPSSSRVKRVSGTAEWNGWIKTNSGAKLRIDMMAGYSLVPSLEVVAGVEIALKGDADLTLWVDLPTVWRARLLSIEEHPSGAMLLRLGLGPQPVTVAYCTVTTGGYDTVHVLDLKVSARGPRNKK